MDWIMKDFSSFCNFLQRQSQKEELEVYTKHPHGHVNSIADTVYSVVFANPARVKTKMALAQ